MTIESMDKADFVTKRYKLVIKVEAGYFTGEEGLKTLQEEAQDWFDTAGKNTLEGHFKSSKKVKENSYLQFFTFEDTVDKEA